MDSSPLRAAPLAADTFWPKPIGRFFEARNRAAKVPLNTDSFFSRFFPMSDSLQRTLVLLKPDAVERRLIGQLIARFENKGLNVVAMKMLRVTPDLAKQHYAEHVEKPFYPSLESFITSAPIVALAIDGLDVIKVVRDMLGATNGLSAAAGTIRGDYSSSRQMNLVHASDGPEASARELALYFDKNEICDYEPVLTPSMRAGDE